MEKLTEGEVQKIQKIDEETENFLHKLFKLGIFFKGINGTWEIVTGLLFLFLSRETFSKWFSAISKNELLQDPNDKLINFVASFLQNISGNTKIFAALYILFHGILNIFLVVQLYRDKPWAYLVTIWTMAVFVGYQIYRISIHHSSFLIFITIFDLFFMLLSWHEYKYHKKLLVSRS
jgi:uncharacterized membrane protein